LAAPCRNDREEGNREETPRTLILGDRRISIVEILDRWLAPDHRYFKVTGQGGDLYILRQDAASGAWELTLFQRGESGQEQ
jgi:hypothetical protein